MTMSLTLMKVPQQPRKESFAYTHRLGTFLKGEPDWRGLFAKRYLEIRNLKWPLGPETSDKLRTCYNQQKNQNPKPHWVPGKVAKMGCLSTFSPPFTRNEPLLLEVEPQQMPVPAPFTPWTPASSTLQSKLKVASLKELYRRLARVTALPFCLWKCLSA